MSESLKQAKSIVDSMADGLQFLDYVIAIENIVLNDGDTWAILHIISEKAADC